MVEAIDTHCHLEDEEFDKDRSEVIERARQKEILMITSGLGIESAKKVLQITSKHNGVYASIGLEPYSDEPVEPVIEFIKKNKSKLVAIGEVGLDYYWQKEHDKQENQRIRFRESINLAKELDLPIIVHSRSAGKYAINMLIESKTQRVVMHAFDGRPSDALRGVARGFFFSIPPSIIRSEQKQRLVKALPLENLLLETDSPVLGPDPKGRNEPVNVFLAAKKIAEIKGISVEKVLETTTKNAVKLFKLPNSI